MVDIGTPRKNRLIHEKSPYLLQHAHNPVDWYPWGDEAFVKAGEEDKPVFLSIGYSTCHWCHVMERECFEDNEVAALLNKYFVCIKVDREERPDLDQIYMGACQVLTGRGGWPLTVFLTPDKKPFFAGTYFPKSSRFGITGMMELLPRLVSLWGEKRAQVIEAGEQLLQATREQGQGRESVEDALPGTELLDRAYRCLGDDFDKSHGGFGGAPKFPQPHRLTFLLRYWKRTKEPEALKMVTVTLKNMARGGIFDQLGYGFHRYSTDNHWLAPHFEKMLYDQALLALAYLEAFQVTAKPEFAEIAGEIFEYVLRDLHASEGKGAFFSAEDADTQGKEGLFYLWTPPEIIGVLGEEQGGLVAEYFGVTAEGNFEDRRSIPHCPHDQVCFAEEKGLDPVGLQKLIDESRVELYKARSRREHPFRDDKILTAWNGLIIAALARGAAVLDNPLYAEAAAGAVVFIKKKMTAPGGRLCRRYRDKEAAFPAYLDDYAFLVWGLLELYQATFEAEHLEWAMFLNQSMLTLFQGAGEALQFTAIDRDEQLPVYAEAYDGAIPSGNSVAALNLLKLGRLTGRPELLERGEAIIRAFGADLRSLPVNFTFMLSALDFALGPSGEVTITGEPGSETVEKMAAAVRCSFHPNMVLLFHPFTGQAALPRETATAQLCCNQRCLPPVSDAKALAFLLNEEGL